MYIAILQAPAFFSFSGEPTTNGSMLPMDGPNLVDELTSCTPFNHKVKSDIVWPPAFRAVRNNATCTQAYYKIKYKDERQGAIVENENIKVSIYHLFELCVCNGMNFY